MSRLQITGVVASVIGATLSVTLLLIAGKSTPLFLLVMFVAWVALPFAVLVFGIWMKSVSQTLRSALSMTGIVIVAASIGVYSYFVYSPLSTTPARIWLLTPAFSFIVIAAVTLYVGLRR